jgi:ACS family glucarate transporter-like MFS transporter
MSKPTTVRWRLLLTLVFVSAISYVLRYTVSTAGVPIMEDFGFSEIQFGWVLAAFTAGYAIFQFPGGIFGVTVGLRRALVIIMIAWAILTILTAIVPSSGISVTWALGIFIALRFLVGASHAPLFPVVCGLIERWFPIGGWGLPNGLTSTGLTLGAAAVPPLLGWLMLELSWRESFLILSPLGFLSAGMCWWYLRDEPAQHSSTNDAEISLIAANRPVVERSNEESPSWFRVLKNRNIQLLTLSYFCANYVFYHLFNWVYYYFVNIRGFDEQHAAFVTSIQWVSAAVGATLGGFICDYVTRRAGLRRGCRWTSMIAIGASGIFLLIAATPVGPNTVVACLALGIFFMQIIEAPYWTAAIGIGGRYTAEAGGVMNTGGNAVGVVNALLVPITAELLGWPAAMATAGVFALIAAALWIFIRADEQIPD